MATLFWLDALLQSECLTIRWKNHPLELPSSFWARFHEMAGPTNGLALLCKSSHICESRRMNEYHTIFAVINTSRDIELLVLLKTERKYKIICAECRDLTRSGDQVDTFCRPHHYNSGHAV